MMKRVLAGSDSKAVSYCLGSQSDRWRRKIVGADWAAQLFGTQVGEVAAQGAENGASNVTPQSCVPGDT